MSESVENRSGGCLVRLNIEYAERTGDFSREAYPWLRFNDFVSALCRFNRQYGLCDGGVASNTELVNANDSQPSEKEI